MKKFLAERKRFIYLVAPAMIGAFFLILCILNINQSVSTAEAYNLYLTRFDFKHIWQFATTNANPPLYYCVLKIWAHIFGHSVSIMRILSAIFGAVAIVFAYLWLKYKYGVMAAIISTFLMSLSPILIHAGQTMDASAMIVATVCAATFFLQVAVDNHHRSWWIIYAILLALGIWTSNLFILVMLAHFLYLLFIFRKKIIHQKPIILSFVLPLVASLPLWPSILRTDLPETNINITNIASFWTQSLFYETAEDIANWLLILAIFATIAIVFLMIRFRKQLHMLTSLIFVPLIGLMLLSISPLHSAFSVSQISYSAVALSILVGVAFTLQIRSRFARKHKKVSFFRKSYWSLAVISMILGATFIYGLNAVFAKGNLDNDVKPTAQNLYSDLLVIDNRENLSIIANSTEIYYELSAYETSQHDVHFTEEISPLSTNIEAPLHDTYFGRINDLDDFLASRDSIFYVGVCPASGYIDFPRTNWRVATFANLQYNDDGACYQILKLEKE